MTIFSLLIQLALLTVALAGSASLFQELGIRWDRRWLKRRFVPRAVRRRG